jgi:glycosyltransferase involved in cell wall biosynthesis
LKLQAPLRVLHLNAGNMMGGIESLLLTLATHGGESPETDHQFALCFDDTLGARLRALGDQVFLLPQVRLRHLPSIYQSRRRLRMLLEEFRFDIAITHSPWMQLIFGGVIRQHGIPLVFWMHGPCDGHWLQKLASHVHPDFVICNSQWTRSTLNRLYPQISSTVIYAPVAPSSESFDRAGTRVSLGIAEHDVAILIAARMEAWKGHLDLLRALSEVSTSTAWKLLIAGEPNTAAESAYFHELQREASAPRLAGRVQFLGFRSDVAALFAASDIYCQPNREPEPFGIVFLEAMQAGVPVITSAMGGAREILNAETAMLIAPGDGKELARALGQLIGDPVGRAQLGKAGTARARELCGPARQMRSLSETIQSVVERYRERAR